MFVLITTNEYFLVNSDTSPWTLIIARNNNSNNNGNADQGQVISIIAKNKVATFGKPIATERIDAIIGIFHGVIQRYLIVVTKSAQIGTILHSSIRAVGDFKIIPFASTTHQPSNSTNPSLLNDEKLYLHYLKAHFKSAKLYFSYEYDITLNAQRIAAISQDPQLNALSLPRRADDRFFWNRYLCEDFLKVQIDKPNSVDNSVDNPGISAIDHFVIPLLNGYVYQAPFRVNNIDGIYTLLGRRSVQRAGRRYTMRGVDINGFAANTAETEQHVMINQGYVSNAGASGASSYLILSFVQTRGSVPVLWEQPANLKYAPKIRLIGEENDTTTAFKRHFDFQYAQYGRQIGINLVNQKGGELTLVNAYQYHTDKYNNNLDHPDKKVKLIHFDFHHECRKMKYENLSKLISQISNDMNSMQYFAAQVILDQNRRSLKYTVKSVQNGVFRSNCVDCLDRTNVVQNLLALHALSRQFETHLNTKILNIDANGRTAIVNDKLDKLLRLGWSNNADYMSIPYSGTPALKTDFTRTGKRTLRGYIDDGKHSLQRYRLNNFYDGDVQDGIDLVLGYYRCDKNRPSPFQTAAKQEKAKSLTGQYETFFHPSFQRSITGFFFRFSLAFYCLLFSLSMVLPKSLHVWDYFATTTNVILFSVSVLVVGSRLAVRYGRTYVNKPKLRPPEPYNPNPM